MAEEPKQVLVQASRIDDTMLPAGFSLAYRLYVIQQGSDLKSVADASNNANGLAYQATLKNEEQDLRLDDQDANINQLRVEVDGHELRITANTAAIELIDVRLTTSEGNIVTLRSDVDYLLDEVIDIQADMVSKSTSATQTVQAGGGSLIVGPVATPTTDKLQIGGNCNATSYKVAGLKVVGARDTGWTPATGTSLKSSFNADATWTIGATYSQSEIQAVTASLSATRKRLKALEDMARAHGLID